MWLTNKLSALIDFLSHQKLKTQLIFLTSTLAIGIISAVYLDDVQDDKLIVNGPVYQKIVLQKDLVADILPPPEYLIEAWQLSLEMYGIKPANMHAYIEKGKQLRKDFETRNAYWAKNLSDSTLKTKMTKDLYQEGIKFLDIRDQAFIPAVVANNQEAMTAAIVRMKDAYIKHRAEVDAVVNLTNQETAKIEAETASIKKESRLETYLISVAVILYAILVSWLVVAAIRKKLGGEAYEVHEAAQKIAEGVLSHANVSVDSQHNTVLSALNQAAKTLQNIDAEMAKMQTEHAKGNMDVMIDTAKFKGEYRNMAQDINNLVDLHVGILKNTSTALTQLSEGNLSAELAALPGELVQLNQSFDGLRDNIKTLIADMDHMSHQHDLGETDAVIDASKFDGDFALVARGVNEMVCTHVAEKERLVTVMDSLGRGDLTATMDALPGKKANINKSLDRIRGNLKGIVDSINWVNNEHELGNIDMTLNSGMFKGQFAVVADSVNKIVGGHIELNQKAMAVVKAFGEGNFNAPLEKFPGKKAFINETIEQVRSNLKALNEDAQTLARAAREGQVDCACRC